MNPDRIPSLDGLRAIGLLLVIYTHAQGTVGFPIPVYISERYFIGYLALRMFFVLSGFLITSMLLTELDRTGTVNLPRFYFRRTLRIFPAYYVYLLVVAEATALGWLALRPGNLFHAFTYTTNYLPHPAGPVRHTWSLAVEEQFYLLWPAALAVLGRRRGMWFCGALVAALPLLRVGLFHLAPYRDLVGTTFETIADALATGCLLAGLREWLWDRRAYRRFIMSPMPYLLLPVLVRLSWRGYMELHPVRLHLLGYSAMNVGLAIFVDFVMRRSGTVAYGMLNWKPFVVLGSMSYSFYLWQQLFLDRNEARWPFHFPISLGLIAAVSLGSHFLVERPLVNARYRIEAWWRTRMLSVPAAP